MLVYRCFGVKGQCNVRFSPVCQQTMPPLSADVGLRHEHYSSGVHDDKQQLIWSLWGTGSFVRGNHPKLSLANGVSPSACSDMHEGSRYSIFRMRAVCIKSVHQLHRTTPKLSEKMSLADSIRNGWALCSPTTFGSCDPIKRKGHRCPFGFTLTEHVDGYHSFLFSPTHSVESAPTRLLNGQMIPEMFLEVSPYRRSLNKLI